MTASTTRYGVERGALRDQRGLSARRRVEHEEADLVLGDVDDAVEADAGPRLRQLLGGRARPRLACGPFSGVAASEERLDEVARHAVDATTARRAVKTSERLNFAQRCLAELAGELGPRAHAELRVDVRQVARDRALGEEERAATSAFVRPVGDEVGHAPLGRRQAVDSASVRRSRPSSAPRPLGPAVGARAPRSRPRAASIASRAGRFCRAAPPRRHRARAAPARGRTDRRPPRAASTARSSSATAASTSPRAAATRPRQRVTCASTQSRSSRRAVCLPRVEPVDGVVDAPELEQRLDLLRPPPAHASARAPSAASAISSACREARRRPPRRSPLQSSTIPSIASGAAAAATRGAPRSRQHLLGELARARRGRRGGRRRASAGRGSCGDSASSRTYWSAQLPRLLGVLAPPARGARREARRSPGTRARTPPSARPARSSPRRGSRAASRARSKCARPDEDVREREAGVRRRPATIAARRARSACSASSSAPGLAGVEADEREPAERRRAKRGVVRACSASSTAARACSSAASSPSGNRTCRLSRWWIDARSASGASGLAAAPRFSSGTARGMSPPRRRPARTSASARSAPGAARASELGREHPPALDLAGREVCARRRSRAAVERRRGRPAASAGARARRARRRRSARPARRRPRPRPRAARRARRPARRSRARGDAPGRADRRRARRGDVRTRAARSAGSPW